MRKTKTIKIDDREITVKELRVKDIIALAGDVGGESGNTLEVVQKMLPLCVDIDKDALLDFAPSELRQLYVAFQEVNADFLEIVKALGLDKAKDAIVEAIQTTLSSSLADLRSQAM